MMTELFDNYSLNGLALANGNKRATFGHVIRALNDLRIGYLCLLEPENCRLARW
jgi:hypothetical protein